MWTWGPSTLVSLNGSQFPAFEAAVQAVQHQPPALLPGARRRRPAVPTPARPGRCLAMLCMPPAAPGASRAGAEACQPLSTAHWLVAPGRPPPPPQWRCPSSASSPRRAYRSTRTASSRCARPAAGRVCTPLRLEAFPAMCFCVWIVPSPARQRSSLYTLTLRGSYRPATAPVPALHPRAPEL